METLIHYSLKTTNLTSSGMKIMTSIFKIIALLIILVNLQLVNNLETYGLYLIINYACWCK
jgi:hypothetical protein